MNALVVGAGEMGRWVATVLEADFPEPVDIQFADSDPETATTAAARFDGATSTDPATDQSFDIVAIAVPMSAAPDAIAAHAPQARTAIVDVTGVMAAPVAALDTHAPDCERASLHPLFAPANEPGNVPVVTSQDGPVVEKLRTALRQRGNDVFETTPEAHDEAMETVQAKTHAAVLAFALAGDPVPEQFHTPISGEVTDVARTVTDGDADVYAEIQQQFEGASELARAAEAIADADEKTFEQLYNRAREEL